MANNILLKKSSVASKTPTTADLDYGELALNYADGALYYKTSGNAIARLNPPESIGFANVAVSGQSTLVADTATGTLTVAAGNGAITVTTNSGTDTLTISHADTSSVANLSSDNSAGVVLQDIAFTFDTYGHVQTATVATTNLDTRYLQTESDTLATVTTRGATTTNAITVGGLTVNGASSLAGDVTNVDSISFDLTAAEATGIGKLYWDAGFGQLRYGLGGGNVEVAIGQTQVTYVRNAETSTITKGQVVYLFGAQGDRPSVKLASNSADTTSSKTFGIAAENIAANSDGYVINTGVLSGVDTSAYTPGDILWLGSTAGTYTTTKAVAPNHLVFIGVVVKANQGGGQIYVKPQNGYELDEIHDVLISGIGLNHSLFYDTSVNVWKNYAPSAARTNLGLGTIATQNANNVSITGGAIDGTPIGATTPSTGKFTTLQTTGDATIGGNLTVSGTTTTVNAQNLNISDNLFYLNAGSTNSNPDLGFAANYNDGTYRHAGFFRDATDGYWKVFKNYTPEPDASIYIDTSHASFALADIQAANFRGALVGNATTASTLAGTPTINGVTFNGGSNITITANTTNALTIGDGLSGTSFNGSSAVTIAADSTIARRADVHYIGTTSIALNRTSAAQTLTGINGLTAVGTNQSITLTPTGTGGVGIGTSSPNELLSIGYIDGSYGRIEFRSASYARQAIIEGVDDASSGNGHLAIYTRNSGSVFERLRVTSTGRLGIGTTNPTAKIHAVSGAAYLRATLESETTPQIIISNGTQIINFGINGDVIPSVTAQSNDPLVFGTNNIERARFTAAGDFGIGTTSPSYKLHAYAASGTVAYFATPGGGDVKFTNGVIDSNSSQFGLKADAGNKAYLGANNAQHLTIDISGNVGIGTTSPGQIVEATRSQDSDTAIKVTNTNAGASATAQFFASNGTNQTQFYHTGTAYGGVGAITANQGGMYNTSSAGLAIVANNAAGVIKFVTGGTGERVRIDASGNVGIGTNNPQRTLDVSGNIRISQTSGALDFVNTNTQIWTSGGSADNLRIKVNGSDVITIPSTKRVGIGVSNPIADLDIVNTTNDSGAVLRIQRGGAGYTFTRSSTSGDLEIKGEQDGASGLTFYTYNSAASVARFKIDSNGNVGIGTSTPGAKLDVNGDIHANGTNGVVLYNADPANYNISRSGGDLIFKGGAIVTVRAGGTGANNAEIVYSNLPALYFKTANSTRMTIDSGGSVGIGVSPSYTLDVAGGFRTDRSSTGTVARLQASGITAGQQANLFLGKSDTNNNEATFVWHHVGDGSTSNYLGIGAYGTDDVLNVFAGNRVGVATTASVGNTTLTASLGIAAYSNTAGVSPYLQTYNGNAALNEKTWRMGGQANGKFQIETVNDAYSSASTKVIISQTGNVGIGVDPTEKLHVAGAARITGILYDSAYNAGTNGQVLTSTGTGTAWSSTGAAVTGTGTTGKIAKWSATTALADSVITESSGNIGIDTTPTQKLDVNGNIGWNTDYVLSSSTITTTSTTANQVITSVAATSFRTFKFIIQATDATAGKYQSQEILAVHNGSTVAHTEYTAINVGGAVATYDVDIIGSTVRLLCTPLSANSTVFKVSMQLIKV